MPKLLADVKSKWLPPAVQKLCDAKRVGKAVVTKKHHYYTAGGISTFMLTIGMMEPHWHLAHWVYAVMETLTETLEGKG